MEIPEILIRQIKEGNVVLFLGAGATKGAIHPEGKDSPTGRELANLIALKFLGTDYVDYPLASVAEYSISESSLFTVQKFIADIFSKFEPSESHLLIPTFRWKSIVTTNYDTIIEKAYNCATSKVQTLVKFVQDGQSIDNKIISPNDLPYFKLHGCINEANNEKIPFILTVDQYVTHKQNRERLFSKVLEMAGNYPILFVGHSLEDPDIRAILLQLDKEITNRERSYIIIPSAKNAQKRLWEGKKVSIIESTLNDFMIELKEQLKGCDFSTKVIDIEDLKSKHNFFNTVDLSKKQPSDTLISYLGNDLDFISPNIPYKESRPSLFYKGISNDWYPIVKSLDIKRELEDDILTEIFLDTEEDDFLPHLYLIKGHAGTGKTVLSKRIAWNASKNFEKKCFYLHSNSILRYDIIEELYSLIKEHIYIFVDDASRCENDIYNLLVTAKRNKIAISIITTERTNVWNVECSKIKPFAEQTYVLNYLGEKEINDLLHTLDINNCLGVLKGKSKEIQIEAFSEKAGRELLVALYEATQGKSFQDIVCNEFNDIPVEGAKPLYLTVCLLHSIGSYTRAGLLNRVYGINFSDFKNIFFKPLENLVLDRRDYYVNDYVYESRHRLIAEFVVNGILTKEQDKFDEYIRILNNLDVDYDSDRNAFLYLTNGRTLNRTFRDINKIRQIYSVANQRSIDDPKLMQQEAILEMNAPGGNLKRAEELLKKANQLTNSTDSIILHSLSELKYNLAEKSVNLFEKRKYFKETEDICKSLLSKKVYTAHPYHTILKSKLSMLKIYLDEQELTPIEKLVKDIEKYIAIATQAFPEESFIIEANANFNTLMNNAPKAKELLKSAYEQNNKSPYLAARLATMYENEEEIDKAIEIIKTTLSAEPANKDLNYKMGVYLSKNPNNNLNDILFYLRRSFTKGDNRYHAQFWYARALYLNGQIDDSLDIFKELKTVNLDPKIKYHPRGTNINDEYKGEISYLNLNSGHIKRDIYGDKIFFFRHDEKGELRNELQRNKMVKYKLAFNYYGPIAIDIILL